MNIGVIFAGGVGARMHTYKECPKQFLKIYNKPIIVYTIEHFENCADIDAVVVACVEEWIPYMKELVEQYRLTKVKKIVPGGDTGQLSICNGINAAYEIAPDEKVIVLIHDGVRPLINSQFLSENIACVKEHGSAITSAIVKETIVIAGDNGQVESVLERDRSRVAKAPQSFWLHDIMDAHRKANADKITNFIDSCTLMQHYGYKMHMIDGPYENIKITTPDDYYTMRAILEAKENSQIYGLGEWRDDRIDDTTRK